MHWLIAGLIIFFGAHLVPAATGLHGSLVSRFGTWGWKGIMAVISIIGFVLIVIGWQRVGYVHVYTPPAWGHEITRAIMLPAMILLAAAYIPGNAKRITRHPMLWATVLWATGHLLANGDLRALLVFGTFLAWALFDMWSCNHRGATLSTTRRSVWLDVLTVGVGIFLYFAAAHLHRFYTGVPLFG
ncbi:MAG: NnrU family protein [Gammaproteobacteria bacterium]|nr:NnrU family protein [Gammaproteobacteria bacterium]